MSKRTILKNAMSKKYCGSTYFDYLDKEELPLIYKAMEEYSKPLKEMMNKILAIEDAAFGVKGFDSARLKSEIRQAFQDAS